MKCRRSLTFYEPDEKQGGFEQGIQSAIERLLVSFNFLFRIESPPPRVASGAIYELSEHRSRVSPVVLSLEQPPRRRTAGAGAARGTLDEPKVLEQQVRRMLRDPTIEGAGRRASPRHG